MDLKTLGETARLLRCPATKLELELLTLEDAEKKAGGRFAARPDMLNAKGKLSKAAGITPWVLLRQDLEYAYPVVDGIPILLAPEILSLEKNQLAFDLTDPKYAEAYEEMEFYNEAADNVLEKLRTEGAGNILYTELAATPEEIESFPAPWERWVDMVYDSAAQWDAYEYIGSVKDKKVLQLGGSGSHAVKFAMGGAEEIWVITPMLQEARYAKGLADGCGVGDRIRCIVAVGEEIPIMSETIDAIFAGGCLHHMQTHIALPEAARILRPGGRFTSAEPWQAPLYTIGTKILGKREAAYCRPLTHERVAPVTTAFRSAKVIRHGTLTRYFFLALSKFGINASKKMVWKVGKIDDAICSLIPGMRGMGSSISILGEK